MTDDDLIALAHAALGAVRRAGGQAAADQDQLLLALPDGADPLLLEVVELARPGVLAVLTCREALARAAHFAKGCRWRKKAICRLTVPPPVLRRLKGAQAAAGGPE